MKVRLRCLHRAQQRKIGVAGIGRVDAALHTHLCPPARNRLACAPGDFTQVEIIGRAAQRIRAASLGERTEAAFIGADIGVVEVAVDHEGHFVAVDRAAQRIGGPADIVDIRAARPEQQLDLACGHGLPGKRMIDDRGNLWTDRARRGLGQPHQRLAGGPAILPSEPVRIRLRQQRAARTIVLPRRAEKCRIGGQACNKPASGRLGGHAQRLDRRPGAFRVHMIGRDRRNAAPVVDACGEQTRKSCVGKIGRRLQ